MTVRFCGKDGQNVVEAVNEATDETLVVRGDDLYLVIVELAQQCASAKNRCVSRCP